MDIDQSGTYKYVLLRLQSRESKDRSKLLVRGGHIAGYHRDIVQSEQQLHASNEVEVSSLLASFQIVCMRPHMLTQLDAAEHKKDTAVFRTAVVLTPLQYMYRWNA